jgi:hypothetical protein
MLGMLAGNVHPGDLGSQAQVLLPRLAKCVVEQIEIIMDGFLTIANDHQVDKVCQRFWIDIGHSPSYQNEGIALIALCRQEGDVRQFEHLQQVQIVILVGDRKTDHVKIA